MRKILFVCKNALFPIQDGAQRRTVELASYLKKKGGFDIDLICFDSARGTPLNKVESQAYFDNVTVVKRKKSYIFHFIKRWVSYYFEKYTFSEFGSFRMQRKIKKIQNEYEIIYFQGYDCMDVMPMSTNCFVITDLLVNPIEQLNESGRYSNYLMSAVFKGTVRREKTFKYIQQVLLSSTMNIFLTQKDKENVANEYLNLNVDLSVIGMHVDIHDDAMLDNREYDFIFCGIDNILNRLAVHEMLKVRESFRGFKICVFGNISHYIEAEFQGKGVIVEDVTHLSIDEAHQNANYSLCIVPMGTGLKTKVLTAIKNGTIPIICKNANSGINLTKESSIIGDEYQVALKTIKKNDCNKYFKSNLRKNLLQFSHVNLKDERVYGGLVDRIEEVYKQKYN